MKGCVIISFKKTVQELTLGLLPVLRGRLEPEHVGVVVLTRGDVRERQDYGEERNEVGLEKRGEKHETCALYEKHTQPGKRRVATHRTVPIIVICREV